MQAVVRVISETYVLILDAAIFLFVPPAPSSTINKSASARAAIMSVPPSISIVVISPSYPPMYDFNCDALILFSVPPSDMAS